MIQYLENQPAGDGVEYVVPSAAVSAHAKAIALQLQYRNRPGSYKLARGEIRIRHNPLGSTSRYSRCTP
jgi:hypothetical protein